MKLIWICIVVYAVIIVLATLTGCSSLEKKINKAKLVAIENPQAFNDFCASAFPVREVILKGKDSIVRDSIVRRDTITIIRTINGVRDTIKAPCPPCKSVTKTIYRTDTVKVEDTAKLSVLREDNQKMQIIYAEENRLRVEAEKQAKTRLWILIGIGVLFVAYVALKIKKVITF